MRLASIRRLTDVTIFGFCVLALSTSLASASQLAMGLRSRGVYVQEFWRNGKPYYAIANWSGGLATIGIREFSYRNDGARFLDQKDGPIVREWSLDPFQVAEFEATDSDTMQLVGFVLNSERLGLMRPMKAGTCPDTVGVVTASNMNGWGGSHDVWFEQPEIIFKSSSSADLTMVIQSNSGKIAFGAYERLTTFGEDPDSSEVPEWDQPISLIEPLDVSCETLPVTKTGGVFTIDTFSADPTSSRHRVHVRVVAPVVEKPSPVVLGAFEQYGRARAGSPGCWSSCPSG